MTDAECAALVAELRALAESYERFPEYPVDGDEQRLHGEAHRSGVIIAAFMTNGYPELFGWRAACRHFDLRPSWYMISVADYVEENPRAAMSPEVASLDRAGVARAMRKMALTERILGTEGLTPEVITRFNNEWIALWTRCRDLGLMPIFHDDGLEALADQVVRGEMTHEAFVDHVAEILEAE